MMDGKAVMETSVGGEAIEMEYDMLWGYNKIPRRHFNIF
jgi:hypothetical protein